MNNQLENIRKWLLIGGIVFLAVFVVVVKISLSPDKSDRKIFGKKYQPVDPEIEMVFVEGSTFWMGCNDELGSDAFHIGTEFPEHEVTVNSFFIGKYEVTQAQWQAVMGDNPSLFKGVSLPVEQVNWYDAQKFVRRLSAATGKKYRLPTEAEWEYAARGGNKSEGLNTAAATT